MNFSTPSNSFGNTAVDSSSIFKNFKDLKLAIWKNPEIARRVLRKSEVSAPEKIVRQYTLDQASKFLGKTEAAFRLFLWENGISADGESNGNPLFSEDLLDLIDSHGYLFDYAKKWRLIGHHVEAERYRKEANKIFEISFVEQESYQRKSRRHVAANPEYIEDWGGVSEDPELSTVSF